MESNSGVVRVKEEPSETLAIAGDEYVFDSLHNHIKIENYEPLPFHEISAKSENKDVPLQERLDKKILIDFECKNVKLERPNVKKENQNSTNYTNEKSLIILIKKGFNYDDNCQMNVNSQQVQKIIRKRYFK
ncbi:uncharacterized protein LOC111694007 [Trichogramma pretiosum]|uniref:uncharacterized protein LOC111694007 n=1 Tax=Trichogramma pretiosum TaxID=7493 RepID=UPI000C718EF3|nr:uncharacterized protein LOC111694007 [Trichogramma pretiosum]